MKNGLISVVMGVHNEKEEYLRLAVSSILNQSYNNLEFIIIDDFSDAPCKLILEEIAVTDSRIRLFHNDSNLGLTISLNKGIELAEGEYIARMDADDYSTSERLEKQIQFLNTHQDIDILGGGVVSFGNVNVFMSPAFGITNNQAQCNLFFQSTLCHPSVIMRKAFLDKYYLRYDENVKKGQDYDMWERCSVYGKLAVMKDVLLYYRTHASQISSTDYCAQDETAKQVSIRRLTRLGITPSEQDYKCHLMLLGRVDKSINCHDVYSWMQKILKANEQYNLVDSISLSSNLQNRYVLYKVRNGHFSLFDIVELLKTAISRWKMNHKLAKVTRLINETIGL